MVAMTWRDKDILLDAKSSTDCKKLYHLNSELTNHFVVHGPAAFIHHILKNTLNSKLVYEP